MATAILVNVLFPARWDEGQGADRSLSFMLLHRGAVAIIFGSRVLWRQKLAIAYLFLAWPYPYQSVLLRVLDAFTNATLFSIDRLLAVVHVARPVSSLDSTLFSVVHQARPFPSASCRPVRE